MTTTKTISEKLLVIGFAATMRLLSNYFDLLFPRTTWVDRRQKDKPFWIDFSEAEMMGWQ